MKKNLFICCLAALLTLPAAGFAMDHNMAGMDHSAGMGDTHKGMVTVGEQVVDGVKAVAHLKDVKATMAKMGMKETHHFMVLFSNAKDGKAITVGSVAVKIKGPDGSDKPAIKLMGMEGHFGADVIIEEKGAYVFTIGTQLADGVKRQFELKYEVK
jgi:hypothetical protein